jgi:hypothetical protein
MPPYAAQALVRQAPSRPRQRKHERTDAHHSEDSQPSVAPGASMPGLQPIRDLAEGGEYKHRDATCHLEQGRAQMPVGVRRSIKGTGDSGGSRPNDRPSAAATPHSGRLFRTAHPHRVEREREFTPAARTSGAANVAAAMDMMSKISSQLNRISAAGNDRHNRAKRIASPTRLCTTRCAPLDGIGQPFRVDSPHATKNSTPF